MPVWARVRNRYGWKMNQLLNSASISSSASQLAGRRIAIVAPNASMRMGGEAVLPHHYFSQLRSRGVDVHLLTHERCKAELQKEFPDDLDRIHFARDTWLVNLIWPMERMLPESLKAIFPGLIVLISSQRQWRKMIVEIGLIDIVHCVTPVSPKAPWIRIADPAKVIMGPMNGGMTYPRWANLDSGIIRRSISAMRQGSEIIHRIMPGKRDARLLLVANDRTAKALPKSSRGEVRVIVENGVDLNRFSEAIDRANSSENCRFVWLGRMISLKAVDLLLEAFSNVVKSDKSNLCHHLDLIGDGDDRPALERLTAELALQDRVTFHGWKSQSQSAELLSKADVFVFPSLKDCGGAVILEAMAMELPVIATNWGGPIDYVIDGETGYLVEPSSREELSKGISARMDELAGDSSLRQLMGRKGRLRIEELFDWERKIDQIISVYTELQFARVNIQPSRSPKTRANP